jgi:hypothetical protein
VDEKESLDKGWFPMLGGEELSKSVLVANAGREAGEVRAVGEVGRR